jgi:triacylglycerol lipase
MEQPPRGLEEAVIRLDEEEIHYRRFDHTGMRDRGLPEISRALDAYLKKVRPECGWTGPVDIVCHSMGTCIVRYLP